MDGFKKITWLDRLKEGVQLKVLDFSLQRICERKVVAHKIMNLMNCKCIPFLFDQIKCFVLKVVKKYQSI